MSIKTAAKRKKSRTASSAVFILFLVFMMLFSAVFCSSSVSADDNETANNDDSHIIYLELTIVNKRGETVEAAEVTVMRGLDDYQTKAEVLPEDGKYPIDTGNGFGWCRIYVNCEGYKPVDMGYGPGSNIGSPEQLTITLQDSDPVNVIRNVRFNIVDSSNNVIPDASVGLYYWDRNSYRSAERTGYLTYSIREKDTTEQYYLNYDFEVAADGYESKKGLTFSFNKNYSNPFFDPDTTQDPIVITVSLRSDGEVLEEAKGNAIQTLRTYKNKDDYREHEQSEIDHIINEYEQRILSAESMSSVEQLLRKGKSELDSVKTNEEYENEELIENIYFRFSNGTTTTANENGVFRLTAIDSGTFYYRKTDGTTYSNNEYDVRWKCEVEIHEGSQISWNYIIGSRGNFQPRVVGTFDATVYVADLMRTVRFKVSVSNGDIDMLRLFVDYKDVTGKTIHVQGSEEKKATVQGRLAGTDRWRDLPINTLVFTPKGSVSVDHSSGVFRAWGEEGYMTYSLVTDSTVSASFRIISDHVRVTGIDVYVPPVTYIDYWDQVAGQFTGILEGDAGEKEKYHVTVSPENASNPSVIWEAITPEIATQSDLHSQGIVPKKAGTAEFIVRSIENPAVFKKVSVQFKYRNPLYTAEPDQEVYHVKKGQTISFNIITNGKKNSRDGASDQRFKWTYNTSGIAQVTDKVISDVTLSGAKECKHYIRGTKAGTVYATGFPYDDSESCKPVKIKIVVTNSDGSDSEEDDDKDKKAVKKVEDMINEIGVVTLDKKQQIIAARAAFNALTVKQKGMVDDGIYAKLVAAELRLRELERSNDNDSDSDESNSNNNNNTDSDTNNSGETKSGDNAGEVDLPGSSAKNNTAAGTQSGEPQPDDINESERKAAESGEEQNNNVDKAAALEAFRQAQYPEYIEAREANLDDPEEPPKVKTEEFNLITLLLMVISLITAFIIGVRKKYREYRIETGPVIE